MASTMENVKLMTVGDGAVGKVRRIVLLALIMQRGVTNNAS